MNTILTLPLKKQWYDMIESGEKKEEYREIKPYWCNRLLYYCTLGVKEYWEPVLIKARELVAENPRCFNLYDLLIKNMGTRGYTHVRFSYGYTKRTMLFELDEITVGKAKPEWGGNTIDGEEVFILKIGKRIE